MLNSLYLLNHYIIVLNDGDDIISATYIGYIKELYFIVRLLFSFNVSLMHCFKKEIFFNNLL